MRKISGEPVPAPLPEDKRTIVRKRKEGKEDKEDKEAKEG
jgi:hypothetical protein